MCYLSLFQESEKHRFYHDFLQYAFPEALSAPWQAYPEHLPCTLPTEGDDQWHMKRPNQFSPTKVYGLLFSLMFSQHKRVINIPSFSAFAVLHSLGLKVYNDKLKMVENILKW